MRAHLLNGTGSAPNVGVFGASVGVGTQRVNGLTQSIASAVQWIAANSAQIAQWVGTLFSWIGPGYDSENGGEVSRQMEGIGQLGQPWCNSYMDWLKNYRPDVWNSGDVWDAGEDAPGPWRDVYNQYIALGLPDGSLLDANKVPVGLGSAIAAVEAQNAVTNAPAGDPVPTEQQLQALQILAMQIAGMEGPTAAANASATVAQFPRSWQDYVSGLVAAWQTSNGPTDGANPPAPVEGGMGGTGTLLLAGAAVLILANK